MKRLRAGEWALLLLPCVALGGFAWWQKERKPPSPEDYAPKIEQIEVLPATPLQVYQGFDTRVIVRMKRSRFVLPMPQATPVGFSSVVIKSPAFVNARGLNVSVNCIETIETASSKVDEKTFAMKLARVPSEIGEVRFTSVVWQWYNFKHYKQDVAQKSVLVPVSVVVRRQGETVRLPTKVTRYRPFALTDLKVSIPRMTDLSGQSDTEASFVLRAANSATVLPFDAARIFDTRLEAEQGAAYQQYDKKYQQFIHEFGRGTVGSNDDLRRVFQFPLKQIPKSAGRVTLKALVSVDDCWPLPISVVVRNRDGSIPVSK